mmetsp:Transcript_3908/g.11032  ORF Transcript_3908/g.11032 Transcript_3908/m.11032 type:complete len:641 (-) Transcript_3908:156-2078(-)
MASPAQGSPMDINSIIGQLSADEQFWLDLGNAGGHAGSDMSALGGVHSVPNGEVPGLVQPQAQAMPVPVSFGAAGAPLGGSEHGPGGEGARASGAAVPPTTHEAVGACDGLRVDSMHTHLLSLDMTEKVPFLWERCTSRLQCAFAPEGGAPAGPGEAPQLQVRVSLDKSLLYSEKRRQWTWHKKWTLPRLSVELLRDGQVLTGSLGLTVHVTAVVFNEEAECMDEVGLAGKTSAPYVGGVCSFQSLFFKSTSFNQKGASFHLLVAVTHRGDGDSARRLVGSWTSSPIHVDARKRQLATSEVPLGASPGAMRQGGAVGGGLWQAQKLMGANALQAAPSFAGAGLAVGHGAQGLVAGLGLHADRLGSAHTAGVHARASAPVQGTGSQAPPGLAASGGMHLPTHFGLGPRLGASAVEPLVSEPPATSDALLHHPHGTRGLAHGTSVVQEVAKAGPAAHALLHLQPKLESEDAADANERDCSSCNHRHARDQERWQRLLDLSHECLAALSWSPAGVRAADGSARAASLNVTRVHTTRAHEYDASELVGKDYLDVVHQSERALLKGVLLELGPRGPHTAARVQMRIVTKSGGVQMVDACIRCDDSSDDDRGGVADGGEPPLKLLMTAHKVASWHTVSGFHMEFVD